MNNFEIISFDKERKIVNFSYKGSKDEFVKVQLSWNGLTIYFTEMHVFSNTGLIYYVGSQELILDFIKNFEVTFHYGNEKEKYTIENNAKGTESEYPKNVKTQIKDTAFYAFKEVFMDKIYEDELFGINKGDIVVDVGANYGFFSMSINKMQPSKIFCFEPAIEIFEHLKQNIPTAECFQKAVSGQSGKKDFFYDDISSASARLCDEGKGGYKVDVLGINDLFSFLKIEKIDFLKIDCEGSEKEIFEQITNQTLRKIKKIVVEHHSEEIMDGIIQKLNQNNFKIKKLMKGLIFALNKDFLAEEKTYKKIVLVSTFCDTEKKMEILKENLRILKSLNLDTLVIAPNFLPLDEEVVKLSDFVFYTKENPLLKYPVRQYTHWYERQLTEGRVITLHRGFADYGWAALYQTKKLFQIALTFDYDLFYHIIYDLEIDDVLKGEFLGNESNIIHPRRNPNHPEEIWETTLHFMVFDREMVEKIEKEITLQEYLSTNGVAEGEVLKWTKKFDLKTSGHCVKDKIFYWEGFDFFNVSPYPEFKMFISKNPELEIWLGYETPYPELLTPNLRIVFHEIPENFEIDLMVNDVKIKLKPTNWEYIELPINSQKIQNISFNYNGIVKDFTKEYSEINLNQVFYNFRS